MADFVAVIRRTVDGLSENVPEMRAKVYEKARSAVRRQLENMKPRPSDEMIARQMAKLEQAVDLVEGEHAEALPPDADDSPAVSTPTLPSAADMAPAAVADVEETTAEPADSQVEPEEIPAEASSGVPDTAVVEADETDVAEQEAQAVVPEHEPEHEPETDVEALPPSVESDDRQPEADATQAPDQWAAEAETPWPEEPEEHEPARAEPEAEEPVAESLVPEADSVADAPEAAPVAVAERPAADDAQALFGGDVETEARPEAEHAVEAEDIARTDEVDEPAYAGEPEDPGAAEEQWEDAQDVAPVVVADAAPERDVASEISDGDRWVPQAEPTSQAEPLGFWPDRADVEPVPVAAPADDAVGKWDAAPDWATEQRSNEDPDALIDSPVSPAYRYDLSGESDGFLPPTSSAGTGATEPLSEWTWPDEKASDAEVHPATTSASWAARELDQILAEGARNDIAETDALLAGPEPLPEREPVVPAGRPLSYRVQPKRRFSPLVALAAGVVVALGGGAYAYYANREAVNEWASGLVATIGTSEPTLTTDPTPVTGEPAAQNTAQPDATRELSASGSGQPGAGSVPETASGQTEVAAVDPGPQKFTQRLQADGSEIDTGPAPVLGGDPSVSEGKSVAEKTDAAPAAAETATDATTVTPGAEAAATPADTTAAAGQPVAALPGEKMFLYEERLGQSTPTAIPGTAAWSVKEESPGGDARPEPVIQAQITVPDRGLTALMTIKRNADSSLPASHVIEFVFSVPDTFEGGSVDAVQRVAMKRTEQDRGDALIAVPAKITDDFYMIALNDFPEAVTANLQLLGSRSWIDIPITYRNGRRALLTLEKGPTGTAAFNTAVQAWSKLAKLPTSPATGQ